MVRVLDDVRLDRGQVAEFAERGFLLIPQAVPQELVAAGSRVIDRLAERYPPGTLEVPGQVQAVLTIPPFPHRPGMHHIDGFPAEPDGRPGTSPWLDYDTVRATT